MTDAEYDKIGEELLEMFGENLPNPEQEPIRFGYYIKLYKYEKTVKPKDGSMA